MAAQQSFRSALNGFNREDVVHYIEKMNAKHTAELNQLNSEIKYLQDRLAEAEAPAVADDPAAPDQAVLEQQLEDQAQRIRDLFDSREQAEQERDAALEEKLAADDALTAANSALAEAEAQIDRLKAELEEANAARAEAEARIAPLQAELEEALNQVPAHQSHQDEELALYRRAERTERLARERADLMCRQIDGTLADTTAKVDEAATQLSNVADQVMHQLSQLQLAVSGSKLVLKDAAATLYAIRPAAEEE